MKTLLKLAMRSAMALVCATQANAAVITFDEVGIGPPINNFYNGGGGPNLGASLVAGDRSVTDGFGHMS